MRRGLALVALVAASSTLGGCSYVASRIVVARIVIQCERGRAANDVATLRDVAAACTQLIAMTTSGTLASHTAYTDRAFAYLKLKRFGPAISDLQHERIFYPQDTNTLFNLAFAYVRAGDPNSAVATASDLIRLKPNAASYATRAAVYDSLRDYDASVADYSRAIALDLIDTNYYNDRCWARAKAGKQYDLALADCNISLKANPTAPAVLNSRGYVYYRMGRYPKALADIDASMKDTPDFASSLYIRGLIEAKLGDKRAASKDEAAAIAQAPGIAKSVVP